MRKLPAFVVAVAIPASFALGAWAQDHRVHDYYIRRGAVEAFQLQVSDGYMVYLTCLADDCSRERWASDFMVAKADQHLRDLGRQP